MIRNFGKFINLSISSSIRNAHRSKINLSRNYCQLTRSCWNCQAPNDGNFEIFCGKCNHIQNVPKIDYFDLFGIQKDPKVNMKDLTRRFRNIQSEIHPDKFSTKTKKEQNLSAEWSSLVNKAYKTLQAPLARSEYLLKLHGIKLPEDNTIQDPEFLMEVMERNEKVEDAETLDELLSLLNELQDDVKSLSGHFSIAYQSKNYSAAKIYLIRMKYLVSIEKMTKEKIHQIESSHHDS